MKDNIDRRLLFGAAMFLILPAVLLVLLAVVDPLMRAAACSAPTGAYPFWAHRCDFSGLDVGPSLALLGEIAVWGWVLGAPSAIIAGVLLTIWAGVRLLMFRDRFKS